jgi:uncharacterized membrane protein
MLSIFKPSPFFNTLEEKKIMASIRKAETGTSGEVRLYVESHCKATTQERTIAIFKKLKMYKTHERNGVLIYVAMKDKKFSIFGDEGIHQKLGYSFWTNEAATLKSFFEKSQYLEGVCQVVEDIGNILQINFPQSTDDDNNELSDKPVYGR